MKTLFTIITIVASISCTTSPEIKYRDVFISEFGWTFQVRSDTRFRDSAFDNSGKIVKPFSQSGSAEAIDLFTIRGDSTNYISAVAIHDSLNFGNWENYHETDNKWYFEQISMVPKIRILDTVYSTDVIGGISFKKEYIKYYSEKSGKTLSEFHYFGKFRRYELAVNFHFSDTALGESYYRILRSSKFKNSL